MTTTHENDELYKTEKPANDDSVILAIRLPRSQREAFNALCEKHSIEVSVVLRRFIERELNRNGKEV